MSKNYFRTILGQIILGQQPTMKRIIDDFRDGVELNTFEEMSINEAIDWLEENWEYLEPFCK